VRGDAAAARAFPLDAAILFSDILTVPDAMGLGLHFVEGEGAALRAPGPRRGGSGGPGRARHEKLRYVFDAVALIRRELDGKVPLIGFSGSPFTLACYMIEGGGSDDFRLVKSMLYSRPDLLHRILDLNAKAVIAYLNAQIAAGAQGRDGVRHLGRQPLGRGVPGVLARLFAPGDGGAHARNEGNAWCRASSSPRAAASGSRPWQAPAPTRSEWTGPRTSPLPRAPRGPARRAAGQPRSHGAFRAAGANRRGGRAGPGGLRAGAGHVFNLGHGISQHTPPEHVQALIEAVHPALRRVPRALRCVKKNICSM
jgi:uroporphyrinogen decarboxylase